MSLIFVPDTYAPLGQATCPLFDVEAVCDEPLTEEITFVWPSPGYVAKAKNCPIANGGSADCSKNNTWSADAPPQIGPILIWDDYEDYPVFNRHFDWVSTLDYSFILESITLVANGPVGTNCNADPPENTRGLTPGVGISAAWELSAEGRAGEIENIRVAFRIGGTTLTDWGTVDNHLIDGETGLWIDENLVGPVRQTPINKTFVSSLDYEARIVAPGDKIRLQLYDLGGTIEHRPAVLSDVTITFTVIRLP
jgi:hypothetical protein